MIIMIVLAIILDVISKIIIRHFFYVNESFSLIKDFLNITYVRNTGAAWSILDNNRIFVLLVSLAVIVFIIYFVIKNKPKGMWNKIGFSLVIGGAIGNLFDRIVYGYVIDFIDFDILGYDYPIFNLADVFIVMGVFILIILLLRGKNEY